LVGVADLVRVDLPGGSPWGFRRAFLFIWLAVPLRTDFELFLALARIGTVGAYVVGVCATGPGLDTACSGPDVWTFAAWLLSVASVQRGRD